MSNPVINPAEEIQAIIDNTIALLETGRASIKAAEDREQHWKRLADNKDVELQKIAAAQRHGLPALDKKDLEQTLQLMVDTGLWESKDASHVMAEALKDPNVLVKLAHKLIQLQAPAHSEGSGIGKLDSTDMVADPDGWHKVAALADKKKGTAH